mgnify:CR=1 FL=1
MASRPTEDDRETLRFDDTTTTENHVHLLRRKMALPRSGPRGTTRVEHRFCRKRVGRRTRICVVDKDDKHTAAPSCDGCDVPDLARRNTMRYLGDDNFEFADDGPQARGPLPLGVGPHETVEMPTRITQCATVGCHTGTPSDPRTRCTGRGEEGRSERHAERPADTTHRPARQTTRQTAAAQRSGDPRRNRKRAIALQCGTRKCGDTDSGAALDE